MSGSIQPPINNSYCLSTAGKLATAGKTESEIQADLLVQRHENNWLGTCLIGTCGQFQIYTMSLSSLEVFSFGKREELQMQFCNTGHVEVGTCDVLTST